MGEKVKTEKLTWDEVFRRKKDFIGGDVEEQDADYVYRGPIKVIKRQRDGSYCIETEWTACLDPDTGEWSVGGINKGFVNDRDNPPSDIGDGRITYFRLLCGPGALFPKGGSKLDPVRVKGLNLASV